MASTPTPRAGFLLSLGIVALVSLSARLYVDNREPNIAYAHTQEGLIAVACVSAAR